MARELPTRTEIALSIALSPGEQRAYEQARLAAVARLAGLGERSHPEQRRFQVLAAITELRLLACHPRLRDAESPLPSSKMARFLELAAELAEGGHRALVFSQFTSHLALAREGLEGVGRSTLYLDGQTPPAQRDRLVERFQAGEGELFLISLKAGGTGLNLTAADYVIHLDPWWNPAVEDQATDRAHRIGQQRPVTVYRLISRGTIEESIVTLHAQKRELVAGVLDGMDGAGRLSSDDLIALIRSAPEVDTTCESATEDVIASASALEVEAEGVPAEHEALLERFREHLERGLEGGRWRSKGPLKSYPRAVQRFFQYLAAERIQVSSLSHELGHLVPDYLEALRTSRFPAPASEPIVARSAFGELTRFLAEE